MNRDLLLFCRYYKGQNKNPYEGKDEENLWEYEKFWYENTINEDSSFDYFLSEYIRAGLADFCKYDNVPITLKSVLYNRYAQHNEMFKIEEYKEWYLTYSH